MLVDSENEIHNRLNSSLNDTETLRRYFQILWGGKEHKTNRCNQLINKHKPMAKKIGKSDIRLLTEVELELMNILWRIDRGTVKDVLLYLADDRKLAYTSAATILRILEQKKIVKSEKQGRAHLYIPILEKSTYESLSLQHALKHVFNNDPASMVARLVNSRPLDQKELEQITKIINKGRKNE